MKKVKKTKEKDSNKEFKIQPQTKHIKTKPKWYVYAYEYGRRFVNFAIGLSISWYLFDKCLFCTNCNSIVIIYFSLIALTCFISCGVPIDKIIKINSIAS